MKGFILASVVPTLLAVVLSATWYGDFLGLLWVWRLVVP